MRLPRYSRTETPLKVAIGRPKHALLEAIARYHYLSAPQLTRLVYGTKVLQTVSQHLSELYHGRYADRYYLPTMKPQGSPRAFYALDEKGLNYLRKQGLAKGRLRRLGEGQHWYFLRHTELSNDLLILAHQLTRVDPRIRVSRMKTEQELKLQRGELPIVPDGWIELTAATSRAIAFELDLDTEERRDWAKKLRAYAEAVKGDYSKAFDTNSLTVAVLTPEIEVKPKEQQPNERRVRELINWTKTWLQDNRNEVLSEIMLFASFDPATADPRQVFCEPMWQGLDGSKHSLLDPKMFE